MEYHYWLDASCACAIAWGVYLCAQWLTVAELWQGRFNRPRLGLVRFFILISITCDGRQARSNNYQQSLEGGIVP